VSCAKTAEPVEMSFGEHVRPRNHVLDGKEQFWGEYVPVLHYAVFDCRRVRMNGRITLDTCFCSRLSCIKSDSDRVGL